jgi:hypothetical protein
MRWRVTGKVIRGGQASDSIAFGASFRSRDLWARFQACESRTSQLRLAHGEKRRGTEKVQRAGTGRMDRPEGDFKFEIGNFK